MKETDRITTTVENLRKMGADVEEFEDGMTIHGGKPLKGAEIDSHGDHRIAMAFAIAGLYAEGTTIIEGSECIATSYPGFEKALDRFLGGDDSEPAIPVFSSVPRSIGEQNAAAAAESAESP